MPVERSAGAIIFRETEKGKEFLLLHHHDNLNKRTSRPVRGHWDFPKGHVEKGEELEDTMRREVLEETGISKIDLISGFRQVMKYFIGPKESKRIKFVTFFVASTAQSKITISDEHQGFAWLPYEEAHKLITYRNSKKLLKHAHEFIQEKGL